VTCEQLVEIAKTDHQRLKDSVIRSAKLWHSAKGECLASQMLSDAVGELFDFEHAYKSILSLYQQEEEQQQ
jgi:hypothetical protein